MTDDGAGPMWFCPRCETWVGAELDECGEGHRRPRRPVTTDDVDAPAWEVTLLDRLRAKLRR